MWKNQTNSLKISDMYQIVRETFLIFLFQNLWFLKHFILFGNFTICVRDQKVEKYRSYFWLEGQSWIFHPTLNSIIWNWIYNLSLNGEPFVNTFFRIPIFISILSQFTTFIWYFMTKGYSLANEACSNYKHMFIVH